MRDIDKIQKLVGDVNAEDLKNVDCSVNDMLGIFIPSVGFCNYAITPNHTHPSYMFNIFLAPEHCIIEQKLKVSVNSYLAIALSPDVPHVEKREDSFKRYYAVLISKDYFRNEFYLYTKTEPPEYIWEQFVISSEIIFYIKQFIFEYENCGISRRVLDSLSLLITHKIIRSLLNIGCKDEIITGVYDIENIEQYIHQNFGKKLTVPLLAGLANKSVSNFIRLFKKETGISPVEYILKIRIEKSKIFLKRNDKSITNIALICGFCSTSHFSSYFMKQTGQKPTEYRKIYSEHNYETIK